MLSSMEQTLLDALVACFTAHDLRSEIHGAAVRAPDGLTIEPRMIQRGNANDTVQVQLDFAIVSPRMQGVPFLDSIAGVGDTQDLAVRNAFEKFARSSFHVIAEALTDHPGDSQQVEIEQWGAGERAWRTFVGPLFLQATQHGAGVQGFEPFFGALEDLFVASMSPGPHWMRVFLGALDGKVMGREVLVDGEVWPDGQALLDAQTFEYPAGYASFRNLLIALPAEATA